MADVIITYETLYELLRREKYKKELQKLDKTFFKDVIRYLQEKQAILDSQEKKDSVFASEIVKTKKQLDNIKKIIEELYERRESKIVQDALFYSRIKEKPDFLDMLPEERVLYEDVKMVLDRHRGGILMSLLAVKLPETAEEPKNIKTEEKAKEETKLVRFLHSVAKFVGDDLNIYGPFEEEDIAHLPVRVADVLVNKNRAEEIKDEDT